MADNQLILTLNSQLNIILPQIISDEELHLRLSEIIDHLIEKDFKKLVYVLYKVDVSEVKLKQLLHSADNEKASDIIAQLIIERQTQKIASRKKFTSNGNISEEEKW